MKRMLAAVMIATVAVAARAAEKEATMAQFTVSSPSFRNNQPMPAKHSCEGEDASPALKWDGAPAATKSFALIVDDPDAPGGSWVHWLLYSIPGNTTELPLGIRARADVVWASWLPSRETPAGWEFVAGSGLDAGKLPGAKQGINDFGLPGYGGPCPPRGHGVHHYHFRLYALDSELNLAAGVKRHQLDSAMKGHILGQTELVGTYQRD